MNNSPFPPMPEDRPAGYRTQSVVLFDLCQQYETMAGDTLRVIGSCIFLNALKATGYVDFRNQRNEMVRIDVSALSNMPMKRIS